MSIYSLPLSLFSGNLNFGTGQCLPSYTSIYPTTQPNYDTPRFDTARFDTQRSYLVSGQLGSMQLVTVERVQYTISRPDHPPLCKRRRTGAKMADFCGFSGMAGGRAQEHRAWHGGEKRCFAWFLRLAGMDTSDPYHKYV